MAISWVTDAVLGAGKAIQMVYTTKQYIRLKVGDTFLPKSYIVPCSLAWAKIPIIGIKTAVIKKPIVTQNHKLPALFPKKGGKIKLPAPKNIENKAKPVIKVSFENFICFVFWITNKQNWKGYKVFQ